MFQLMTRLVKRTYVIAAMLLLAAILGVTVTLSWRSIVANIGNIIGVAGLLATIVTLCRDKLPSLFYWTAGVRAIFVGADTTWRLTATYTGSLHEQSFGDFRRALCEGTKNQRIYRESNTDFVALLDSMNVQLCLEESAEPSQSTLYFHIYDYHASIDRTNEVFEDVLLPVLTAFEDCTRTVAGTASYVLTIKFPGLNPYLGLFARRIGEASLRAFEARIVYKDKSALEIRRDSIRIESERTSTLQSRLSRTIPIMAEPRSGI
jgi:hypothetical protein